MNPDTIAAIALFGALYSGFGAFVCLMILDTYDMTWAQSLFVHILGGPITWVVGIYKALGRIK